jgi:5-methylcytosine-specific restriction endonuclease McrA
MPITKERRKLYPDNWKQIARQVKAEAGLCCELCGNKHGQPHDRTGSKVVLTVHHLDYDPTNNVRLNLIALCQRCHNRIDRRFRVHNRKLKRRIGDISKRIRDKEERVLLWKIFCASQLPNRDGAMIALLKEYKAAK